MSEQTRTLGAAIQAAFRGSLGALRAELPTMPLSRWNEAVFRYIFSRAIATHDPEIEQFVECKAIDLVLAKAGARAFIEFKFYVHPDGFDPYTGVRTGYKGRPSPANLREFRDCVDTLAARPSAPGLSKYIVLLYADRADERRVGRRYADDYAEYRHPTEVGLALLESSEPIESREGVVHAKLFSLSHSA